jgi:hypothetical protein
MTSSKTGDFFVRVNIQRMIENAARLGVRLNDSQARDRLNAWGFRAFGQNWLGDAALLKHLSPDEVERVDPADLYGMFPGEIPPGNQ